MDKDTLKGKGKDIAGKIERQAGEWTDREDLQAEGAGRQVEGKVQKGIGRMKEAGRDIADRLKKREGEVERDEEVKERKRRIA